jgi:hypothetical protein
MASSEDTKSGRPWPPQTGSAPKPPVSTFFGFSPTHRHKKTGGLYQLMDVVIDATNNRDGQKVAIYRNSLGVKFVREVTEFMDGRFEEVVL